MECAHFLDSLLRRPALERDAVRSDEHAAAVAAQPAVDEDFPSGPLANQREELGNFFICGCSPAGAREIDKANAEGLCVLPFILDQPREFAAQIDNSIDAELLELCHSVILWLCAAIEEIINLTEI